MFSLPVGGVTMRRLFSTTTRNLSHDNPLVSKRYQTPALHAFAYYCIYLSRPLNSLVDFLTLQ